ncbi:GntR family transcriptional regulator [Roseinatronobacter alkalisoli]|uniref:GntR family transcriptional regulator n=1 Tax=Roseinatronobacter alkalisoli TaxID=3028235 RepID=A0ABT5T7U0_9RHOB|nr:GntR family transcriptional regulator [Roseinatronobacter sp. HJB301]MDD7970262.1 GntR family transcriptional regulator [Roseinatronobacter sp. HJB301]
MGTRSSAPAPRRTDGGVTEAAYETFQAALLDGRLRPGQLVSQRDLVDMLHLSVGALRELLPRLKAEGLVLVYPQRGIQVPAIDLPMIRDAFQMRAALEREAVLQAVKSMPDADLHAQRKLHEDVLAQVPVSADDALFARGQEIDSGFHATLMAATRNALLINAHHINSIRIRLIKLDRISLGPNTLPSAFNDHLAVIDAILSRNPVAATQAMDRHITNARDRAMEL